MVQTGDPGSVNADSTAMLGIGGDYQIDAEILYRNIITNTGRWRTHAERHESRAQEQRLAVLYSDRTQNMMTIISTVWLIVRPWTSVRHISAELCP